MNIRFLTLAQKEVDECVRGMTNGIGESRSRKTSTDFSPQPSISEDFQMLHVCGGDHGLVAEAGELRGLRTQDDVTIES